MNSHHARLAFSATLSITAGAALGISLALANQSGASGGGFCSAVGDDLPGCACYVDPIGGPGEWPPLLAGDASRDIIAVAERTLGTITSCHEAGGQPYWQMQLQFFGRNAADLAAEADDEIISDNRREAWCTETIAYWHNFANRPYFDGYVSDWHESPFVKHTQELREWYQEAERVGGRGRWIDGSELDQENFIPGVNGPCPGAYVQWEKWDQFYIGGVPFGFFHWKGAGDAHSQMVDSMVVHQTIAGTVRQIDLFLIDGNTGRGWAGFGGAGQQNDVDDGVVFNSAWVTTQWKTDISRYVLEGGGFFGGSDTIPGKYIRGWGIDLDAAGDPMCDGSRIRTEFGPFFRGQYVPAAAATDSSDSATASKFMVYQSQTGFTKVVTSNSTMTQTGGTLPNDSGAKWLVPAGTHPTGSFVEIDVDLLANHPLPVRGVVVDWKNGTIPPYFEVWWSAQNVQIFTKSITLDAVLPADPNVPSIPYPVRFATTGTFTVRYTKLRIPNPVPATYEIIGFHYLFYDQPEEDSGSVYADPFPPCDCGSEEDPHGDITRDGQYDVTDVVASIGIAFRGMLMHPNVPTCPKNRSDVNCDNGINVLDVVETIDVAFRGADVTITFCDPCMP